MATRDDIISESIEHLGNCGEGLYSLQDAIQKKLALSEAGHLLGAATFARAIQYLRAAHFLISRHDLLASNTLARSACECWAVLAAMNANLPQAFANLRKRQFVNDLNNTLWLQERGIKTMSDGEDIASRLNFIRGKLAEEPENSASKQMRKLFELGGLVDQYLGIYSVFSASAHAPELGSIYEDQFTVIDGQPYILMSQRDLIGPIDVLMICEVTMGVSNEACRFFGVSNSRHGNLEKQSESLRTRVQKLIDADQYDQGGRNSKD